MIGPKEKKGWPFYARRDFLGEKKGLDLPVIASYRFVGLYYPTQSGFYENQGSCYHSPKRRQR